MGLDLQVSQEAAEGRTDGLQQRAYREYINEHTHTYMQKTIRATMISKRKYLNERHR